MLRIKYLRENAKLTQKELSDNLGISPSNISKYEMGTLEPGIEILKSYAKFFDVSIDFIVGLSSTAKCEKNLNNESCIYIVGEYGIAQKILIPDENKERLIKLLEAGLPELFKK